MATYTTNRCVAFVSAPAFERAQQRFPETGAWRLEHVIDDIAGARLGLVFSNPDAEWSIAEFAALPCIGMFGLDGDVQPGVVSKQAADLHAALLALFTRETEGEGP